MEGQIKAERTTKDILKEVQAIINNTSKESFLEYLLKEGAAEENNYLFYCDFILDQIPELYFEHLVEMDINNYCIIHDEIIAKAAASYDRPTQEEIKQYKIFRTKEAGRSPSEEKAAKEIRKHISKGIKEIILPRDKPSKYIWNNEIIRSKKEGIEKFTVTTGKNKGKEGTVLIDISFKKVKAAYDEELTETDRQIYNTVSSIYEQSESEVITVNDICKIISSNNPNAKQRQQVINSLAKMQQTNLIISNKAEVEAGLNYPSFEYGAGVEYKTYLLPLEILTTTINGIETTYIHLLREPPLYTFAKQRNQVNRIPGNIYKVPIRKTEENRRLVNYFIDYIILIKYNKELSKKLTFKKLCKKFDIPTDRKNRMKRKRFQETIIKVLEHFKSVNYIQSFSIDQNKDITFIF